MAVFVEFVQKKNKRIPCLERRQKPAMQCACSNSQWHHPRRPLSAVWIILTLFFYFSSCWPREKGHDSTPSSAAFIVRKIYVTRKRLPLMAFDFSMRNIEKWKLRANSHHVSWRMTLPLTRAYTHKKRARDETSVPLDILRYLAASKNDSTREIWRDSDESAFVIFFIQVLLSFFSVSLFCCLTQCCRHSLVSFNETRHKASRAHRLNAISIKFLFFFLFARLPLLFFALVSSVLCFIVGSVRRVFSRTVRADVENLRDEAEKRKTIFARLLPSKSTSSTLCCCRR